MAKQLTQIYEDASPCIVAFISKINPLLNGQQPIYPKIFGTGFLVSDDGIVATNRHIVQLIDNAQKLANGELSVGAMMAWVDSKNIACQVLTIKLARWGYINTFNPGTSDWYGPTLPDIGFVQLEVRQTPFLSLAGRDYYVRPGSEIATIGFPLGSIPLALHGRVNQITPFIRRGIVSSVYPFTAPRPHGFTVDIMQQGGSSGSPIISTDDGEVVGMTWGGMTQPSKGEASGLAFTFEQATNISLAEPAHLIADGVVQAKQALSPQSATVPTLNELRAQNPLPTNTTGIKWSPLPTS